MNVAKPAVACSVFSICSNYFHKLSTAGTGLESRNTKYRDFRILILFPERRPLKAEYIKLAYINYFLVNSSW